MELLQTEEVTKNFPSLLNFIQMLLSLILLPYVEIKYSNPLKFMTSMFLFTCWATIQLLCPGIVMDGVHEVAKAISDNVNPNPQCCKKLEFPRMRSCLSLSLCFPRKIFVSTLRWETKGVLLRHHSSANEFRFWFILIYGIMIHPCFHSILFLFLDAFIRKRRVRG